MHIRPFIILLNAFLFICILYYFLRFQFGFDQQVLLIYTGLMAVLAAATVIKLGMRRELYIPRGRIDLMVLAFFVHSVALVVITYAGHPSPESVLYSLKDYVFPVVVYAFCRLFIWRSWPAIMTCLLVIFTIVSAIYITEFVDRFIMGNGGFVYTEKVRLLTMEKTGGDELSTSVVKGELYDLVRMEGPLSHNNVTGLAMALGAVLSLASLLLRRKALHLVLLAINLTGLALAAPRTAIFALLVASTVMLLYARRVKLVRFSIPRIAGFAVSIGVPAYLVATYFMDLAAFGNIYSIESIARTLAYLVNLEEFSIIANNMANPLAWLGAGYAVPNSVGGHIEVLRSDDVFFVQMISMYGVAGILLFLAGSFYVRRTMRLANREQMFVALSALGILVAMAISTVHTNALIRPQLYPVFFVALAAVGWVESLRLRTNHGSVQISRSISDLDPQIASAINPQRVPGHH